MTTLPLRKATLLKKSLRLIRRGAQHLYTYVTLVMYYGPKRLVTSEISPKCALMVVAMCLPALLCSAVLLLPSMIFQSPQQQAYFQFAQVIDDDPSRWFALALSGFCAISSLGVPGAMPAPTKPDIY